MSATRQTRNARFVVSEVVSSVVRSAILYTIRHAYQPCRRTFRLRTLRASNAFETRFLSIRTRIDGFCLTLSVRCQRLLGLASLAPPQPQRRARARTHARLRRPRRWRWMRARTQIGRAGGCRCGWPRWRVGGWRCGWERLCRRSY